jgi:glucose/arabinose dehydrogenase
MKSGLFLIILSSLLSTSCVGPQVKNTAEKNAEFFNSRPVASTRNQASDESYITSGLCNGLQRINSVSTAPGFCLGLIHQGLGLVKPRYALQIDPNRILLTEMGGWKENAGQVYLLTKKQNTWELSSLINAKTIPAEKNCILDRTQQLIKGPDQLIYVTSAQCIATIDLSKENSNQSIAELLEIKIPNLPTNGLHSLKIITFDTDGNILMNVGSITDNCENESSDVCKELEGPEGRGLIRKYSKTAPGFYDLNFSIFSQGQRNSMGLYWDEKSNSLWTAENARDYINRVDSNINGNEHPGDEFNIVRQNAVLDWPYCYDAGIPSPEFPRADCSKYQKPHLLFPAHSAPLSLLMYTGKQFPAWYQNRLLISLHGYETYGHRIVTYKRNDQFQPVGEPLSVVYGWDGRVSQKVGAPVGLTQALDGSVLIVEDNNASVLQLFYEGQSGNGSPVAELKVGTAQVDESKLQKDFLRAQDKRKVAMQSKLKQNTVPLFTQIQNKIIDQNCIACHGGLHYPKVQILMYDDVGNYKKLKDQLASRLKGEGVSPMPPYGLPPALKAELFDLVDKWIAAGKPAP